MAAVRSISAVRRRALIARRHLLDGSASTPEEVAAAMVGLHATEPTTVVLSVLARSADSKPASVMEALYERRGLVKWLAMRRTLFVLPTELVPSVQVAVSDDVARLLRQQLINRLVRNGSVPAISGEVDVWIQKLEAAVLGLLEVADLTGAQLGAAEPRLRTLIPARTASEIPTNVTSYLLAMMSAAGQIVRGRAGSSWTSRAQQWQPAARWFPDGLPRPDLHTARRTVAKSWLTAFGPAPLSDLQWWTGWTKTAVQAALRDLPLLDVDIDGHPAVMLDDQHSAGELDVEPPPPSAALLPTLDPTPMGWQKRNWFMSVDDRDLYDGRGNLGPTIWWDGQVIGGWGATPAGKVRTAIRADRGAEAKAAVDAAAAQLEQRLDGAPVTPSVRTPLERRLSEA